MHPLRNLPVRSSLPSASSADGEEDATTAGQQPTHSPRYSPTQASAALPELTHVSSQEEDEFGLWIVRDFLSSQPPLPSEPTDATFRQALPQSWSALMEESTPNFLSGGPGAALDVDPAVPPQSYVDPRMLSVFGSAPAQQAPSLAEPSDIPADSQPSTALDPAQGKRPLSVEPDTAQQRAKRPACGEGVEPDAASGNLDPAWPPTRDAGPIHCPKSTLSSIFQARVKTRTPQLQHHECSGHNGIKAVVAACAEMEGTLVADSPPGTYKFENVVVKADTRVGFAISDKLKTDQRIHAVYLLLQKGEEDTDELMDFHIHVPVAGPVGYANTEEWILTSVRRSKLQREEKQMVAAYREKNPRPDYTFQEKKKMDCAFESNQALLKKLDYHYPHELDQTLRDCKEALGHLPLEGKNDLTLSRNGTTVKVRWVFENGKTADLIIAEDAVQLQDKASHKEEVKSGMARKKQIEEAGLTKLDEHRLFKIAKAHKQELKALGWENPKVWKAALRDISLHCDAARVKPEEGKRVSDMEILGIQVQEFKLTGLAPAEKNIQGLRWVDDGELWEIKFFKDDKGKEQAVKDMEEFITRSLRLRKNK